MDCNYNEIKKIARCPKCGGRVHVVADGHNMTGTTYNDGGRDDRWVSRLACGHLVQVEAYSNGADKQRSVVAITIDEFEDCRI